ncbi:hypothetical protein K7X08_011268 [Anisodus acutangulus]|uniref:BHLH domain-containing protein n=1 Tax=Anisodus acutangulus TaxID=402998 RepID=A0A9Q1RAB4_9SOLA|nr:hypothetical protein K7X08_011268 [Anisodus acutangulus]
MDDLALIFSHHHKSDSTSPNGMQENNDNETSRKRLHEDGKAAALSCIISFNNSQHHQNFEQLLEPLLIPKAEANTISFSNINENSAQFEGLIKGRRTGEQAQEHLLAERNRRRKIAKLFVSLASLLPGLNKMDKASILEGAINLIRQLREKAETVQLHHHLETKTNIETNNEAPAVLKKARNYEHQSSIDMMMKSSLPQVEVRSLEEDVLITVYCKKQQKGNIDEILTVIQELDLTIKSSNFMPFGSTTMHITLIAQMNAEFCETTDYLAEKLRLSIIKV